MKPIRPMSQTEALQLAQPERDQNLEDAYLTIKEARNPKLTRAESLAQMKQRGFRSHNLAMLRKNAGD